MIEAMNCPFYHNRFLRQFEIPICTDKRRSAFGRKHRRQPPPSVGTCRGNVVKDALLLNSKSGAPNKIDNFATNLTKNFGLQARRRLTCFLNAKCPPQPQEQQESVEFYKFTLQLVEDINRLLEREQPLSSLPASLREVNPECGEKVDGTMRDDAVFNLLFLHKCFYDFSVETFSRAVHIIDQFLLRVKVKPKYMACVSAAAYFIAMKECEPDMGSHPTAEDLVSLTHCGGTGQDLDRMMAIIRNKLQRFSDASSAVDYLQVLSCWATQVVEAEAARGDSTSQHNPVIFLTSGDVRQRVVNRILYSLTSFECREYSSACLALACLLLECHSMEALDQITLLCQVLAKFADMCQVPWEMVQKCSELVQHVYEECYCATLPCSRAQLFWCVSRRTRASLCLIRDRSPALPSIRENRMEEEIEDFQLEDDGGYIQSGDNMGKEETPADGARQHALLMLSSAMEE